MEILQARTDGENAGSYGSRLGASVVAFLLLACDNSTGVSWSGRLASGSAFACVETELATARDIDSVETDSAGPSEVFSLSEGCHTRPATRHVVARVSNMDVTYEEAAEGGAAFTLSSSRLGSPGTPEELDQRERALRTVLTVIVVCEGVPGEDVLEKRKW